MRIIGSHRPPSPPGRPWDIGKSTVASGLLIAGATLAGILIPAGHDGASNVDCSHLRLDTVKSYSTNPRSLVEYPAGSEYEKQCQINEYEQRLSPTSLTPPGLAKKIKVGERWDVR